MKVLMSIFVLFFCFVSNAQNKDTSTEEKLRQQVEKEETAVHKEAILKFKGK